MPQEETIDVLDYLRRLAKFLVPGLLAGLLVAGLMGLTSQDKTTGYEQKAHVLVMPNEVATEGEATQQSQLMPMMLRAYVALEDVPVYTDAVSQASQGRWSPEEVAEKLTIYWGGGSNLLAFIVEDSNLDDANQLSALGAKVFVSKADQMVPGGELWQPRVSVVETNKQQSEPAMPQTRSPLVLIASALVTALVVAGLLELLSNSRRRRKQPATSHESDQPPFPARKESDGGARRA